MYSFDTFSLSSFGGVDNCIPSSGFSCRVHLSLTWKCADRILGILTISLWNVRVNQAPIHRIIQHSDKVMMSLLGKIDKNLLNYRSIDKCIYRRLMQHFTGNKR